MQLHICFRLYSETKCRCQEKSYTLFAMDLINIMVWPVNMLTLDWGCMAAREQNDVYSDLAMMVT